MSFKPMRTKPLAFILFLFIVLHLPQTAPAAKNKSFTQLTQSPTPGPILIDKIAAVVNEEIITMIDIGKAVQFYPAFRKTREAEEEFYTRVLEDLINYKVVYLEYKNEFILKEEDYDEVQTAVIEKLGSLDKLMALLDSFDMEWKDFKDFVKEKVIYERVLKEQLQEKITIDFKEIENFYNEEYRPLQEELELQPLSLFEMAPQIENHLRKVRTRERLADWLKEIRSSYKIENKLLKEQQ
ncbi:MAG: hypothetical protein JSV88_00800 [Candidatus Aminicenantes bacterium]|nr:MAG: hypothetical protein JSV88_00800 [Candidatus Aminicenantes bacterium]